MMEENSVGEMCGILNIAVKQGDMRHHEFITNKPFSGTYQAEFRERAVRDRLFLTVKASSLYRNEHVICKVKSL
jgi:hypothetical protein